MAKIKDEKTKSKGGQASPDGLKLAPPFLIQVDFDTLAWLEERRKTLGLRSRAEVIRAALTQAISEK